MAGMKARIAVLTVVAAAVVAVGVWGFQAGRRAILQADAEARRKVAQAVQEAQSKAQAAAVEAERQAQDEARSDSRAGALPRVPEGEGPDEAFLVKSITIEGLEKAGLTAEDLGDIEIEIDQHSGTWGRPMAGKVRMASLLRPVSPLCLYKPEINRMAKAVVELINKRGLIGVYVRVGDPGSAEAHPEDGNCHWRVYVGTIERVQVEDHRAVKGPDADLEAIRAECPLKVGEHLSKPKLDAFAKVLKQRFPNEVNISIGPGDEVEQVVLIIVLGPAETK
jgi:hemolysin activation/secretion protein